MKEKIYTGWHFLREDKKLQFEDQRKVRKNIWMKAKNCTEPVLCQAGMHASPSVLEALQYAPGPILCRVELRGKVVADTDKMCGLERRIIGMVDFTPYLHEFACSCAEDALKIAKVDDPRCWNAIKTKRAWLAGKATDAELDAARDAAWAAARDAARAAAWAAQKNKIEKMALEAIQAKPQPMRQNSNTKGVVVES